MRRAVIVRRVLPTVVDVGSSLAKACAVAVQLLLLEAVRCGVGWAGCTGRDAGAFSARRSVGRLSERSVLI